MGLPRLPAVDRLFPHPDSDAVGCHAARVVIDMTQQYLAGELSLLLARLQAVSAGQVATRDVVTLRHEAEAGPLTGLASVTVRALNLTDGLCWESLSRGDTAAFTRQAALGVELHEFGVCAGLFEEI